MILISVLFPSQGFWWWANESLHMKQFEIIVLWTNVRYQKLFYFYFLLTYFLATSCGMWDLHFLTRDQTCISCSESRVLTTGLPARFPQNCFKVECWICCSRIFWVDYNSYHLLRCYLWMDPLPNLFQDFYCHTSRAPQVVLAVKNLSTNVGLARDTGTVPRLGRSPGVAVYLPGKFQGQRTLAGYSSLGCKELDTNETPFPSTHTLSHLYPCTKGME